MNVIEADKVCLYIFSCVSESIKLALETEYYCEENELDSMKFYHFENKQHSRNRLSTKHSAPQNRKYPPGTQRSKNKCVYCCNKKSVLKSLLAGYFFHDLCRFLTFFF